MILYFVRIITKASSTLAIISSSLNVLNVSSVRILSFYYNSSEYKFAVIKSCHKQYVISFQKLSIYFNKWILNQLLAHLIDGFIVNWFYLQEVRFINNSSLSEILLVHSKTKKEIQHWKFCENIVLN